MKQQEWSFTGGTDANFIRRKMSHFSRYVRRKQFNFFMHVFSVQPQSKVLDIGTSPDSTLSDTNFFEEIYPFKKNLFIASIEDCTNIVKQYRLGGYIRIYPSQKVAMKDKSVDYVVSWATLEHVGTRKQQKEFVHE